MFKNIKYSNEKTSKNSKIASTVSKSKNQKIKNCKSYNFTHM